MRVVVTGGAGFVGSRLVRTLLSRGKLRGLDGQDTEISEIIAFDVAPPQIPLPKDHRLSMVTGDISDLNTITKILTPKTHSIFHFAGVVSGQAEADLELGMRINIDGTRALLNACLHHKIAPRFVFSSSIAVYGKSLPSVVEDGTPAIPETSYGVQKACCELLINDYTRRKLIDGRSVRLPTVIIRPGKPNPGVGQWSSTFFREPLTGLPATCPVEKNTRLIVLSIRKLIEALIKIHDISGEDLGFNRVFLLPALSTRVHEMEKALHHLGGEKAVNLVSWKPDPSIQKIYNEYPQEIMSERAKKFGIYADKIIDEIVQHFIDDDLESQKSFIRHAK